MYKIALQIPLDSRVTGARQPSFSSERTLAMRKKQNINITVTRKYGMLVYDFTAGDRGSMYFCQSDTNFFTR